jgi:hypothetical protein
MNENRDESLVKVSARRRLIRGAFAAPAALQLYSGGALANASSVRCVANQVAYPEFPAATTAPDVWVRVRLWTVGADANLSAWVSGSDVIALVNGLSLYSYLPSAQWQCFAAGNGSGYTVGQLLSTPPTKPGSSLAQNGSYVAVRVDSTGKIIGVVGLGGGGGSAVRLATCWASFAATLG